MKTNKILLKVIVAFLLALIILVVAFVASARMTKDKLEDLADVESELKSEFVTSVTNVLFESNEWVISSFLAGIVDIQLTQDSLTGEERVRFIISDNALETITANDVFQKLESFIAYHTECTSALFILQPQVFKKLPDGIAAKVSSIGEKRINLIAQGYDIFHSKFYEKVKNSDTFVHSYGLANEDSTYLYSHGVTILDKQENVIGELWIDVNVNFYSLLIERYTSENDLVACFVSHNYGIIASKDSTYNGRKLRDVTKEVCEGGFPDDWVDEAKQCIDLDTYSHFKTTIDGQTYITYIFPIANTTSKILIIKPEEALYDKVAKFMWTPYLILGGSFILVLLCLTYIFLIFKRKTDENSRMENELNVAATIQKRILPTNPMVRPEASSVSKFDIYGFQRQAKTVGGDLYDFVVKGDLLHFCIGDVSGKGMPAAMVMAELCSLYRYVVSHCTDPNEIVSLMNKAVMERSDNSMLCTLFVGILDLKSGLLKFCNAGHNPPIAISKGEGQFLCIQPNMPLYAFKNYPYQSETLQMTPGDRLFLYTDGVTEAKDKTNHFFGTKALLNIMSAVCRLPFDQMVKDVMSRLKDFANKAEQNDDITILCVEYKGPGPRVQLHYDYVTNRVTEIVDDVLIHCHKVSNNIKFRLAIEEPIQNIVDYAYNDDGPLDIDICSDPALNSIEITLTDSGKPFNPLKVQKPDFSTPIMQRSIGGLGIYLTQQVMDEVLYRYHQQKNVLFLKYHIK